MQGEPTRREPVSVTLLLVPRFSLTAMALCVDVLRVANRESLRTAFAWSLATPDGGAVVSSAGIEIAPDLGLEQIDFSPITLVLAAYEPEEACSDALLRWLKRQGRRGGMIGCIDTGALILARAGLVEGMEISVHGDAREGARENYRRAMFTERIFTFQGGRCSSAGGVATADLLLGLVEQFEGEDLANRVALLLNHVRRTDAGALREKAVPASAHPVLARCIGLMQTHVEDPIPLAELCDCAGVAPWTLRRLFRRHLGTTPAAHYRGLRLDRARQLLIYSHLSVAEIAAACGFAEIASLSHAYSRRFGVAPSRARWDNSGLPARRDRQPPGATSTR